MNVKHPHNEAAALRTLRIVWAVMLVEMAAVAAIAYIVMRDAAPPALTGELGRRQAYLFIAMFVGAAVGYFARMQFYKRHWRGDRVEPAGYLRGNVVLFSILNAVALASCVLYLTGSNLFVILFPAAVMTALMAVNYPTGGPMTPYRRPLA